jgi:glucose-6-phosphate 1-dehydrogenase
MATTEIKIAPEHVSKPVQSDVHTPDPIAVVIFGASGDLTKRKLLPALFHLEQAGLLPDNFSIVGVARRPLGDSFAADMKDGILKFGGVKDGAEHLDAFIGKVRYHAMNFDDPAGYDALKTLLEDIDKKSGTRGNRLFYLATAPEYFADIIDHLGGQSLKNPLAMTWSRRAS